MNVFDLFAKLALDKSEYEKGLDDAEGNAKSKGSKIGKALAGIGKVAAAGFAVASAAVGKLAQESVESFANYEQLVGGVETLFSNLEGTVSAAPQVLENAKQAYETAGVSANQYMETVTGMAAALLASSNEQVIELSEEEIKARSEALDEQYDAVKSEYEKEYDTLKDSLEDRLDGIKEAQDAEVEAYQKATEEKIALIDKEYRESLKLIDKEEYDRLQAIDEQIAALKGQTEAERKAAEEQANAKKREELQKKIAEAESIEDRQKYQDDLAEFEAKIQQKRVEEARNAEIEKLKGQKDAIKEETAARKEAAKEQKDAKTQAIKEESAATLAEMKKANEEELKEARRANSQQLKDYKDMQNDKLKELKKNLTTQKEALSKPIVIASGDAVKSAEDYAKAAEIADMAMIDMADNANKMGTPLESIQNAYAGFAKQNYTMLDNLHLGYNQGKQEMERLLADAEKISGIHYDINNLQDVYKAIHVIQESLGIAGATAKEADHTISGSLGALKASWENLVTGISDPEQDVGELVGNVMERAGIAISNIIPVIGNALEGIGNAVVQIAPALGEQIPQLLITVLPTLADSALTLVMTLSKGITQNLPEIFKAALEVLKSLALGIAENLPVLIPAVIDMVMTIGETLTEPENLHKLLDAGVELLAALLAGLWEAMPRLLEGLKNMFVGIGTVLGDEAAKIYLRVSDWISEKWEAIKGWGRDLIDNFIAGVKEKFKDIKEAFKSLGELIERLIGFSEPEDGPLSNFHTYAPDMIDLFTKGIKDNEGKLRRQMEESFNFSDVATSPEMQVNAAGIGMANAQTSSIYYTKKYNVEDEVHELLVLLKTGRARMGAEITNARELKLQNV